MKKKASNALEEIGAAIGVGLLAGLAGTAAITVSQMIEMKLSGRKPSDTPVKAVSKTLDVQAVSEGKKGKVSQEVHWVYGTSWGIARGLISLAGLRGWQAALVHFSAIWGTSLVMIPGLKLGPPVQEQDLKTTLTDGLHHAVYAAAAGLTFDAIED